MKSKKTISKPLSFLKLREVEYKIYNKSSSSSFYKTSNYSLKPFYKNITLF